MVYFNCYVAVVDKLNPKPSAIAMSTATSTAKNGKKSSS